jgi:hypothetical protein
MDDASMSHPTSSRPRLSGSGRHRSHGRRHWQRSHDAYQKLLKDIGLVVREDGDDVFEQRTTGVNPALSDPSVKPAPAVDCPSQFGNTDIMTVRFTP